MKKVFTPLVIILLVLCVLLTGCKPGKKEAKGPGGYEGYWFILADLDENGEEYKSYGNTRFHITLPSDGSVAIYMERYNYIEEKWFDRDDLEPGYTYNYDEESDTLTLEKPDRPTITFRRTTYNDHDAVEMFPDDSKDKTILTRTNPKPK